MWKETWEKKKIGPKGNHIFAVRIKAKYGGLRFIDLDNSTHDKQIIFTVKTAKSEKANGNNHYELVTTKDGFNEKLAVDHLDNYNFHENWEITDYFFDCLRAFHRDKE